MGWVESWGGLGEWQRAQTEEQNAGTRAGVQSRQLQPREGLEGAGVPRSHVGPEGLPRAWRLWLEGRMRRNQREHEESGA